MIDSRLGLGTMAFIRRCCWYNLAPTETFILALLLQDEHIHRTSQTAKICLAIVHCTRTKLPFHPDMISSILNHLGLLLFQRACEACWILL
jgi:hypothetical protein